MLSLSLVASLGMLFIHACFWHGNLLYEVGNYVEEYLGPMFVKPLFDCLICMSGFWGIIFYFLSHETYNLPDLLLFVLACGGFNVVIDSIIGFFRGLADD